MENCVRCPDCNKLPQMNIDDREPMVVELLCHKDGYQAEGKDLKEAVQNWNQEVA